MNLLKVYGHGYLSLGEFELDLSTPGVVAVTGDNRDATSSSSNGAGKSALLESIGWCLFNKCARGCAPTQVINQMRGECSVTVEFADDLGEVWTVTRTRGKKHTFVVKRSEDDVSSGNLALTNTRLTKAIGFSWPVFLASTYLSPASIKPWPTLPPNEVKALFEDALDMGTYSQLFKEAKRRLSELRKERDTASGYLSAMRQNIQDAKQQLRELEAGVDDEEDPTEEVRATLDKWELPAGDGDPTKLLPVYQKKLEKARAKADSLSSLASQITQVERDLEYLAREKASYQKQIKQLSSKKGSVFKCPTCGQPLKTDDSKERIKARLKEARHGLSGVEHEIESAEKKLYLLKEKFNADQFNLMISVTKNLERAVNYLGRMVQKVEIARRRSEGTEAVIRAKQEEIEAMEAKYKAYHERLVKVESQMGVVNYLASAYGPGGIPLLLMQGITGPLNEYAEYYASILTGGEVSIRFDTTTRLRSGKEVEKFSVTAVNQVGGREYHLFSDGERRRTDLAASLAFRAAIATSAGLPKLLVCDEAFRGIDALGYERIKEVLEEEGKESTIFVVTHDPGLARLFDKRVVVIKENGMARVEVK